MYISVYINCSKFSESFASSKSFPIKRPILLKKKALLHDIYKSHECSALFRYRISDKGYSDIGYPTNSVYNATNINRLN